MTISAPATRPLVLFWAGNHFDGLPATDHHLARALTEGHDVLWVDPPRSLVGGRRLLAPMLREVEPGLRVLDVPAPPGPWRPGLRQVADLAQTTAVRWALHRLGAKPWATLVCSARVQLPVQGGGVRLLHVTDDWLAGAQMMGLDDGWLRQVLVANLCRADVVTAVSEDLARVLTELVPGTSVHVVPNGGTVPETLPVVGPDERRREAVLVGQLNERLDFAAMQAIVDAGVPLRIMGPKTAREPQVIAALERLLGSPLVEWMGPVPHSDVSLNLARARVGITPYLVNDFNQSSFPLKTLEYLALGLPVVSSRLDSLNWLDTDLVDVADGPADFAEQVLRRVDEPLDPAASESRRAFAWQHSWGARVSRLLELARQAR